MDIYLKLFEVLFPVFFIVCIGYFLGKKNPNFDTSFITTYSGNFGKAQDFETLLKVLKYSEIKKAISTDWEAFNLGSQKV